MTSGDKSQLTKAFRHVIGSIVVLFEALSATTLARLLSVQKKTIDLGLRYLRSALDVPEDRCLLFAYCTLLSATFSTTNRDVVLHTSRWMRRRTRSSGRELPTA